MLLRNGRSMYDLLKKIVFYEVMRPNMPKTYTVYESGKFKEQGLFHVGFRRPNSGESSFLR